MKYDFYRMLIENIKTHERKTYTSKRKGTAPAGWKCVAIIGGWEKPKEK